MNKEKSTELCFDKRQVDRLERQMDEMTTTLHKVDIAVSTIVNTLEEREKADKIKTQVIERSLQAHSEGLAAAHTRIDKTEELSARIITTLVALGISIILTVLGIVMTKI